MGQTGQGQDGTQPGGGEPGGLMPGRGGDGTLLLPGSSSGARGGDPTSPGGQGPGAGHGGAPVSRDEDTQLAGRRVDTRVEGERRAGPTRSEVILDGSRRGFASRAYEKVHTDYRQHAERVLERDAIPGGYRFYVRRYFQLIRPREPRQ
jgi:hypothetical protein